MKAKKKNKVLWLIASAVLAVVVALAGIFVMPVFLSSGYEDVVKEYVTAYVQIDTASMSKTSVCDFKAFYEAQLEADSGGDAAKKEEFFKSASEYYGKEIGTVEEYMAAAAEENKSGIEYQYGKYTIDINIVQTNKLDDEALGKLKNSINEEKKTNEVTIVMGVDTDKITEGYTLETEITISGEKQSNTNELSCTVVKYDGEWKVVPNY